MIDRHAATGEFRHRAPRADEVRAGFDIQGDKPALRRIGTLIDGRTA